MRSAHRMPFVAGALLAAALAWGADSPPPDARSELGRPVLRHYTPGEHLRNLSSHVVTQDAAGVVYFGNGGDLLSYDGAHWDFLRLPTESAGVRQFAVTDDGTIFLGGASVLGYLRGSGRNLEFVSLLERLPSEARRVDDLRWVVAVGREVYFSDEEKILIWRDERFTVVPFATPAYAHGARLHRVGDLVYVTGVGYGLGRIAGNSVERVADDDLLRKNTVISVEAGATGALLLLTAEQGWVEVAPGGRVAPWPTPMNRWLAGKRIFRASRLADGSRVVAFSAVSGDGGMRFDPDGRYLGPLDTSIGLLVNTVRDFFCDREGGLWLGMDVGAARLEWPSAVTLFDVANGLGQGAVADLVRHDGVIHVATSEGLFRMVRADETGRGARFERVRSQSVHALVSHPSGLLLLGYAELALQTEGKLVSIARLPPGGGRLLRSSRDPQRVWIAGSQGLRRVCWTPAGWRDEGPVAGFNENCTGLAESADGTLWVATAGRGLLQVTLDGNTLAAARVEPVRPASGGPESGAVVRLAGSANHVLWASGGSSRVGRWDARTRRFAALEGAEKLPMLAAEEAWTIGESRSSDRPGHWLAGSAGIFHLADSGGAVRPLPHFVSATLGAISFLREEATDPGPVLWIGGGNGLARVDVTRAFVPPVPLVTQLAAASVRAGERLPTVHPRVSFGFVAPRQRPTSPVSYQSRLVGLEEAWSSWSTQRERTYANLPPGGYRFEVRARDAEGTQSVPVGLAFAVLAPWWRGPWALAGYALLGVGLVAGVVQWRTRALHQRTAALERVVAQRTGELAERTVELARQNTELIRLHQLELDEKIAARLAEEKARLEVLRYQLNPHFLFNTLASISAALPVGRTPARAMLERLADFCRLTLHRTDDSEWTTLGAEIQLLRTYLEIEQSRWGELLEVDLRCDPALAPEPLPHFLLLPLVENALKYGRATSQDRVGVRLTAQRDALGRLTLEVANTGTWVEPAAAKSVSSLGIGLDNLRERLARSYPGTHSFQVDCAEGWVRVTLTLPGAAGAMSAGQPRFPSSV